MMAEAFGLHPVRGQIWTKVFLKIEKGKSFEFFIRVEFYCANKRGHRIIGSRSLLGILGEHWCLRIERFDFFMRFEFCCEKQEARGLSGADCC